MFLQRNLAQKAKMRPDFTIFVRIVQGVCHVREIHSLIKCQRIVRDIWSLLQSPGNLTLFTGMQEWRKIYLNLHFHPCAIIYSVKHIWFKGQRSTRSMMNVMFALVANGAFSDVGEGVNWKELFTRSARTVKTLSLLHD